MRPLLTYDDFADFLGVKPGSLKYYAYTTRGRRAAYRKFTIPKRGEGTRTIRAPVRGLYEIQRAILDKILTPSNIQNRHCVYSYTPERGALEMAARHISREFVVRLDIENFFGNISFPRVLGALQAFPLKLPRNFAVVIAQLCTYENELPQGAPTSPALSNLISRRMDGELIGFAKEHGFRYSRYSDDLIFSANTRRKLSFLVVRDDQSNFFVSAEPVRRIVEKNSFKLNEMKTRVSFRTNKQLVVGAVCNKKVNVDRKYIRQIRTLLHLASKSPDDALSAYHRWSGRSRSANISAVLRGKIEYLRLVKGSADSVVVSLAEWFNSIYPDETPLKINQIPLKIQETVNEKHVFVCISKHRNYGNSRFGETDEAMLYKTGSCFFLEEIGLITCFHNLYHDFVVFDAKNRLFETKIVYAKHCDPVLDIAVLDEQSVLPGLYKTLKAEQVRPVNRGDRVTVFGYPNYVSGDSLSRKFGRITQSPQRFGTTLYAVDINIQEGESGGPVLNDRGRVIGIVRSRGNENFVIPISNLLELRKKIKKLKPIVKWEDSFLGFGDSISENDNSKIWKRIIRFVNYIVPFRVQ